MEPFAQLSVSHRLLVSGWTGSCARPAEGLDDQAFDQSFLVRNRRIGRAALALYGLGAFALLHQIKGGLKAVALTDIVQVTLLVAGGLLIAGLTLVEIGRGDLIAGFATLSARAPEKFDMILSPDNPFYRDLPGIPVLIGGMWIANLSLGLQQYIIQRAMAAKSLAEAQKGVVFAAYQEFRIGQRRRA